MSNIIHVSVDITCHASKYGDLYITTQLHVPARNKETGKIQNITFKPKKKQELKLEAWQLLCAINDKEFDDANPTLKLKNVQAYLMKRTGYDPYYLIRIRLCERVSLSIFLSHVEISLVTNFVTLKGEFMEKGEYEILPFEKPSRA